MIIVNFVLDRLLGGYIIFIYGLKEFYYDVFCFIILLNYLEFIY